jgi:hypothetical protein
VEEGEVLRHFMYSGDIRVFIAHTPGHPKPEIDLGHLFDRVWWSFDLSPSRVC